MAAAGVKVYAVFKEGVKTYYRHRGLWERLGLPGLDGVIDVSWQRNIVNPEVIVLRRPIQRGDKVLLIDHSAVGGETLYLIMRRIPGVNFVTVVERADYYGAFYVDYMISGGELKRVVDVAERHVDLGDERVELAFGPDDFMVVDRDEGVDMRLRVVESWERGMPVVFRQNPVYLLLRSDVVFQRPKLVADAIGYERVGPLARLFIYEDLRKRWSPSLARVVYRAARKRFVSVPSPVIFVAEVDGIHIPVGFSMYYPVIYKLGLPAYIKRVSVDISGSEVFDAEKLLGEAYDLRL
jgi:hypothetical protein